MENRPVALVTGASSGFGLLTSVELALEGHRVFATMRNLARRAALDTAARQAGVELSVAQLDVTDERSIAAAVAEATAAAGRIDVLVNNAGFAMAGFFEDVSIAELREQLETNFFGLAAVTQAVIPGMRERRHGRVINVSSIAGRLGTPGLSAYCASKFAVEGLMESLRHELAPYGVQVVLVEPGMYRTDIFERSRRMARRSHDPASPWFETTRRYEALVDKLISRVRRDPRDVARMIAHAAVAESPRLRYLVGSDAKARALAKTFLPFGVVEAGVKKVMAGVMAGR